MIGARRRDALVLLFFLCFFGVLSSGRLASSDAGEQLRASILVARTGSAGADAPPAGGWIRAPDGRYYEPHDLGNLLLMLPAAWLGASLSPAPLAAQIANPPLLARVVVSLSCAVLAAIACAWMFRLLAFYTRTRTAFLMAVAFPVTTIFLAYARAAWDVLGACCLICGVLYYSIAILRDVHPRRSALLLASTLAAAFAFRYSLAPFLTPAAAYIVWTARRSIGSRGLVAAVVVFAILMAPSFAYNFIRTGSALRPAAASARYLAGANALTGSIPHGAYGLLLSPNRGLFVFSPVLLVSAGLPFAWSRLLREQRVVIAAYTLAAAAYILLISKMAAWGVFGWGPRYLVPILPIVFLAACFTALSSRGTARVFIGVAAVLSAVLTLPTAVVNWHLATTTWPEAMNPDATMPYQQIAGWKALAGGLAGRSLPVPDDIKQDRLRTTTAAFPDLLLARLARQSRSGALAAATILMVALGAAVSCSRRLMVDG
ncbi:MAG TPA: hypothetical protein VEL51_09720 [Vicinamibacterales bacterium]|nr:hypothetical protein [Vicinamibacterales bacterium]